MAFCETRIYRVAMRVAGGAKEVVSAMPAGYGFIGDQLLRAAGSIALNFAEGCGKRTRADRARFFAIARGSAFEARAAVDLAVTLGLIELDAVLDLRDQCAHVGAMLGKYV